MQNLDGEDNSSSGGTGSFLSSTYDLIIVGGGIIGASCALAATKMNNIRVLLIEQFEGEGRHDRGSSHGDGRIFRVAYEEDDYVRIAQRAKVLWEDIENDANKKGELLLNTGGITAAPPSRLHFLASLMSTFDNMDIPYEYMNADAVKEKFPQFTLEANDMAVYSEESGVLRASESVATIWSLLKKNGCDIVSGEKVISLVNLSPDAKELQRETEYTQIQTSLGQTYIGRKVLLSIGGWAASNDIFALDLQKYLSVTQEIVGYFERKDTSIIKTDASIEASSSLTIELSSTEGTTTTYKDKEIRYKSKNMEGNGDTTSEEDLEKYANGYTYKSMPVFIFYHENGTDRDTAFYGLPEIDIPGIKIGAHHTGPVISHAQEKGDIKYNEECEKSLQLTTAFVERFFPELESNPSATVTCLYTSTPDHDFILDKAPNYSDNVYLAAGFSGHGFKFGPAIGEAMAQWILEDKVNLPIERFRIGNRFEVNQDSGSKQISTKKQK